MRQNPLSGVIDVMSGIFGPLLGVMAALAMLMGLLMIHTTAGAMEASASLSR